MSYLKNQKDNEKKFTTDVTQSGIQLNTMC